MNATGLYWWQVERLRYWLGAIRQQAITWVNVHPDLHHHMVSPCHNEVNTKYIPMMTNSVQWTHVWWDFNGLNRNYYDTYNIFYSTPLLHIIIFLSIKTSKNSKLWAACARTYNHPLVLSLTCRWIFHVQPAPIINPSNIKLYWMQLTVTKLSIYQTLGPDSR